MSTESLVARFFGFALLTIGGLIMLLSGICSGFFLFGSSSVLPMVLVFGGIPFGVGFLLCWAGWVLLPKKPRVPPPGGSPDS